MNFHRVSFCLGAIALVMLASGCFVGLEQPLSDPSAAKPDPALIGKWRDTKADQKTVCRIRFDRHGKLRGDDAGPGGLFVVKPDPPVGFVTRTARATYLNLELPDADRKHPDPKAAHYQIMRYDLSPDGRTLTLRSPKLSVFQRAVKRGKLKGRIEPTELPPKKDGARDDSLDGVVLQDSPTTILRFLESRPADELFDVASVLKKVD